MRKQFVPLFAFVLMLGLGQTTSSSAVTTPAVSKVNMFLSPVSEWYLYGWEDGHYDYEEGNPYKTTFGGNGSKDYQVGYILGFGGGARPTVQ
ncbi:MAG TPA: hypothetical protein VGC08_11925 [Pedobacter sp.]